MNLRWLILIYSEIGALSMSKWPAKMGEAVYACLPKLSSYRRLESWLNYKILVNFKEILKKYIIAYIIIINGLFQQNWCLYPRNQDGIFSGIPNSDLDCKISKILKSRGRDWDMQTSKKIPNAKSWKSENPGNRDRDVKTPRQSRKIPKSRGSGLSFSGYLRTSGF